MRGSAEARGQQLAEEIKTTLNHEFEDSEDYREAVETVLSHFEIILEGLKGDAKRKGEEPTP